MPPKRKKREERKYEYGQAGEIYPKRKERKKVCIYLIEQILIQNRAVAHTVDVLNGRQRVSHCLLCVWVVF